jgi:hypothetical protein
MVVTTHSCHYSFGFRWKRIVIPSKMFWWSSSFVSCQICMLLTVATHLGTLCKLSNTNGIL